MGRGGGDSFAPRLIRTAGLIRDVLSASEIVRWGEALERSRNLLAYQVRFVILFLMDRSKVSVVGEAFSSETIVGQRVVAQRDLS